MANFRNRGCNNTDLVWLVLSAFTTQGVVHRTRNSKESTRPEILHDRISDYNKFSTYATTDPGHAYISELSSNTSARELCAYQR